MSQTTLDQPVSIIIPAYNEAAVIAKCLQPFLADDFLEHNQVIVVCNACTDNTAQLVRQLSEKIVCLETGIPSKTNALNLGDAAAKYYPRIYLDADVRLSIQSINAMRKQLQDGHTLATSLKPKLQLSDASWFVKAYYAIWLELPYCQAGMIGSGVYALSAQGRQRFEAFPNIMSDDGYVRCLFNEQERVVTEGFYAEVSAPKDLRSLIKIKTRSRLGRYELRDKFPHLMRNEKKEYSNALQNMFANPRLFLKSLVYIYINLMARMRANYQYKKKFTGWERDESSRS